MILAMLALHICPDCMSPHLLCAQKDAELHYGNPAEFTLTVPEFEVKPGEVVAVVGRVGCGKYWLLAF